MDGRIRGAINHTGQGSSWRVNGAGSIDPLESAVSTSNSLQRWFGLEVSLIAHRLEPKLWVAWSRDQEVGQKSDSSVKPWRKSHLEGRKEFAKGLRQSWADGSGRKVVSDLAGTRSWSQSPGLPLKPMLSTVSHSCDPGAGDVEPGWSPGLASKPAKTTWQIPLQWETVSSRWMTPDT